MKRKSFLASFVLALALATSCRKAEEHGAGIVEAASKKASETYEDLSKLTPELAQEKVTSLVDQATSKLSAIKDAASAESVKQQISPMLDQLGQLKTALGGKLDLANLEKAVKDVIAKFTSDPGVAKALQPLLEKIQGLMK